jgi:hypothetical protein
MILIAFLLFLKTKLTIFILFTSCIFVQLIHQPQQIHLIKYNKYQELKSYMFRHRGCHPQGNFRKKKRKPNMLINVSGWPQLRGSVPVAKKWSAQFSHQKCSVGLCPWDVGDSTLCSYSPEMYVKPLYKFIKLIHYLKPDIHLATVSNPNASQRFVFPSLQWYGFRPHLASYSIIRSLG